MKIDLSNKTAVITGASRGLGLEIASHFWKNGAHLILVARSTEKLEDLKKQLLSTITNPKQKIKLISTDLINPQILISLIQQYQPGIDVLVNNAAIQGPIGPFWENNWNDWQTTLQINLLTPIALCRAIIPQMIQRGFGRIINLSGGGATSSRPNFSAYATAKTGLVRFSEILADEVKHFSISVNCIAPGIMHTEMLTEIVQAGIKMAGKKEYDLAQTQKASIEVIKRAAKLCTFLASSENKITGKLISATWDPWQKLPDYLSTLKNSDIYTLRRIVPEDRGEKWEDKS